MAVDVRPNETAAQVKAFAAQNNLKHMFLMGGDRLANELGVSATPTTFYLNRQGDIVASVRGLESLPEMESRIAPLLSK
jgi:hypothetical protein